MGLTEELADIYRAACERPPRNETETCSDVIDEVLVALGYSKRPKDWSREVRSGNRGRADYAVHLGSENGLVFCIEAKSWCACMADDEADQALAYVNSRGVPWAVLTNGSEWRIYDNRIQAPIAGKLVLSTALVDPGASAVLGALSRAAVLSESTSALVDGLILQRESRIRIDVAVQVLQNLPQFPEVIEAFRIALALTPRLASLTNSEFTEGWRAFSCFITEALPFATEPVAPAEARTDAAASDRPDGEPQSRGANLSDLFNRRSNLAGTKPRSVETQSGHRVAVRTWADAQVKLTKAILESGSLPSFPFPADKDPLVCLNDRRHNGQPLRQSVKIEVDSREVYVHTSNSVSLKVELLWKLCKATGVDPSTVFIDIDG